MEIGEGVNSGLLGFGILNLSFTLLVELSVVVVVLSMRTIRRNFSSMRECTFDRVDADGEVPKLVPGN